MRTWITRSLTVVVLAVATIVGLATPATAEPQMSIRKAATQVMKEKVGGPLYGAYKRQYPTQLNWTHDGCSIPPEVYLIPGINAITAILSELWEKSCNRHDFGYRNFGSNTTTPGVHPEFSPTEATKHKIDVRFQKNMKLQCEAKFGKHNLLRPLCKKAADVFYVADRDSSQAHKAFFG